MTVDYSAGINQIFFDQRLYAPTVPNPDAIIDGDHIISIVNDGYSRGVLPILLESIEQSDNESVIRVFRALSNTAISGCTMASDNSRWLARGYE